MCPWAAKPPINEVYLSFLLRIVLCFPCFADTVDGQNSTSWDGSTSPYEQVHDFVHEQHHRFANCWCPEMALFLKFSEHNIQKKSWVYTITMHGSSRMESHHPQKQTNDSLRWTFASIHLLSLNYYCKYSSCLLSVFPASVAVTFDPG